MIAASLACWQEKPQITRPCGRVGIMPDWRLVRESDKSRELSKFPDNS